MIQRKPDNRHIGLLKLLILLLVVTPILVEILHKVVCKGSLSMLGLCIGIDSVIEEESNQHHYRFLVIPFQTKGVGVNGISPPFAVFVVMSDS